MFSFSKASRAIERGEGMTHWCWPQFVMTHETCSEYRTWPQIKKDGIIQTPLVVVLENIKDPPTWLKVTTISERPHPQPGHLYELLTYHYEIWYCKWFLSLQWSHTCWSKLLMQRKDIENIPRSMQTFPTFLCYVMVKFYHILQG